MARKWAIRLTVFGAVMIFLVLPGVGVGHVDTFTGTNPTFVSIWWFSFFPDVRPATASNIVVGIAVLSLAAFVTGVGMLVFSWWQRRRSH
jgi:hypothetical protein